METNSATFGFLGFPISVSVMTVLPKSNLNAGRRSANVEAGFKLLYLLLQLVSSLSGDDKQPIDSPVIVVGTMARGRFVLRSQKLGFIWAFTDPVLIHTPDVQFIVKLIIPALHN